MVGGFLGGPPCSGPAEGAPSPEIRGGVPGKALAAIRRSGVERGSDIGLVAIAAMQLGVESAGAFGYLLAVFRYAIADTDFLTIPVELLLAIPLISDTAVNYFYSLLNEEGSAIGRWWFVLANLIGWIARAYIVLWLLGG